MYQENIFFYIAQFCVFSETHSSYSNTLGNNASRRSFLLTSDVHIYMHIYMDVYIYMLHTKDPPRPAQ